MIEPAELTVDSIKAKYYYVTASAHDRLGHLMLSDSLIGYSFDYYKNKALERNVGSATLLALYKYWMGNSEEAICMLDSLACLKNVPDSLLIFPLRRRAFLGTKIVGGSSNRMSIKRLMAIDKDSIWQNEYKYWLYIDYLFSDKNDSALIVLNELIDKAAVRKSSTDYFSYEYEKVGTLEEMGRYSESLNLADKLLTKAPGNSVQHYLYLWKSLSLFNMGRRAEAIRELAKADSCAFVISEAEKGYYNSFAYALNMFFDFQETGTLRLTRLAQINNSQKEHFFRTQAIQYEAEQSALEIENKRLLLKAKNDRQMAIIIIVILATLLISGVLLWYALNRKRKALEAIEQSETLQKLVDELNASETSTVQNETLRRAMLQQLGIIKMVAETPTEQNREMLRKIYSIANKANGSLVNWENVYEIIDNLYSGFYSRLHKCYEHLLTEKGEQIIVLMMAGFSNKEISVITAQTTATVYVRKSAIRKKLGVPEKEDIVAFLRQEALF
ncbi:MAG: LuxR C-terminal-related transcriptional regulator [Bacteroides sp.]|nr:LuxR C-terminal-related transcriptional regulator [Bacteroides sp.]